MVYIQQLAAGLEILTNVMCGARDQSMVTTCRWGIGGFGLEGSPSSFFGGSFFLAIVALFRTYQRTRLSVAMESSTEECLKTQGALNARRHEMNWD